MMVCPCKALENALMESARRGKRITELEDELVLAEERRERAERERDAERRTFANAADAMGCEPEDGDDFVEAVKELTRERDDAREQLYLTKAELGRWVDRETKAVRERDEARATLELVEDQLEAAEAKLKSGEAEWAVRRCECSADDACKFVRERDEARAEVDHAYREGCALYEAKIAEREAFRSGAEAMREACARIVDAAEQDARPCVRVSDLAVDIRALPIPEEP